MSGRIRHRATIRDVAAHAGVSFKSVSNVINGHPNVSEHLRSKVLAAIDELGYRPHSIARSLASQRSNLIGVVLRASSTDARGDPFLSQFLLGVSAGAGAAGFGILVRILPDDAPIRRYATIFEHRQVDGLIVFCPRIDDATGAEDSADPDLPAVRIGRATPGSRALAVDSADEEGACAAVSHLIGLGHRRIGMIANADTAFTVVRTRVQGYRQALAQHNLPFETSLLTFGRYSDHSGYQQMTRLLDLPHPPSAVFVSSDRMALGAMRLAQARGLRIPEDLAVVGYDDLFFAQYSHPPLTTVRVPIDEISSSSTQLLLEAIRGTTTGPRQLILPTRLIVRQSCGAPRALLASPG